MRWTGVTGLWLAGLFPLLAGPLQELKPPVILKAGSEPINVDVGHAAPFVGDVNDDGKPALLVGQFGEGKLRIYRNVGAQHEPRFDSFEWLQAGGQVAKVPTG